MRLMIVLVVFCSVAATASGCSTARQGRPVPARLFITHPKEFPEDLGRLSLMISERLSAEKIPADTIIEVVFYDYSSGKEVFTLSDTMPKSITRNSFDPRLGLLVKIKKGGSLVKIKFLEVTAQNKNQAIDTAVKDISRTIRSVR